MFHFLQILTKPVDDLASVGEAAFIGCKEGDDFRDVLVAPDTHLSASRSSQLPLRRLYEPSRPFRGAFRGGSSRRPVHHHAPIAIP